MTYFNIPLLIFSQLFYDGYKDLAVGLAAIIQPHPACPPSDKLLKIVRLGLKCDEEGITNLIIFIHKICALEILCLAL